MIECKTVNAIETEIKDAQGYLQWADLHYDNRNRNSPSQAEYNYIKRLVDDGQPVVLTKKIRKALKLKDDQQTLDKAMKDDLVEAGVKQSEIVPILEGNDGGNNAANGDYSDEDSADRRKRKLLAAKGTKTLNVAGCKGKAGQKSQQETKSVSKKEKAKIAFKAERERQKIVRPRNREKAEDRSVWL